MNRGDRSRAFTKSTYLLTKRVVDIVGSATLLILLSPLFAVIALLIRVSSAGPVFYRQSRLGKQAVPFLIFKFRTMAHNAPALLSLDGDTYSGSDDPRVTGLGRVLRKFSLDELPQLLNVLTGDMSLIGPRPDLTDDLPMYDSVAMRKLGSRPGMTGQAMVKGRHRIPWRERIELDAWYVDNMSWWLDLQIAARTLPVVLSGHGAESAPSEMISR